jgi:hypothetical protein
VARIVKIYWKRGQTTEDRLLVSLYLFGTNGIGSEMKPEYAGWRWPSFCHTDCWWLFGCAAPLLERKSYKWERTIFLRWAIGSQGHAKMFLGPYWNPLKSKKKSSKFHTKYKYLKIRVKKQHPCFRSDSGTSIWQTIPFLFFFKKYENGWVKCGTICETGKISSSFNLGLSLFQHIFLSIYFLVRLSLTTGQWRVSSIWTYIYNLCSYKFE